MGLTLWTILDSLTRVYQIRFAVFTLPFLEELEVMWFCLSKDGTPNLFKPWLMSSQPCVPYFKCACSFTSVGSTKLIFTWFDFLIHRCRKADAHIRLTGLGSTDNIVYPRHIKNQVRFGSFSTKTYVCDTLPSVSEKNMFTGSKHRV